MRRSLGSRVGEAKGFERAGQEFNEETIAPEFARDCARPGRGTSLQCGYGIIRESCLLGAR